MKKQRQEQTRSHLDVLDGFRGIAIILVMWFHVWQLSWLTQDAVIFGHRWNLDFIPVTGFLGVELFFMISAFCLFYPYARHLFEGKPLPTVKHFAYRRAIKILPSYYLAIILVFLLATPKFHSTSDLLRQLATHLLFIHDWFIDTKNSIIGVLWSLGVEVQFYVLFPLLCWFFRKKPIVTYVSLCAIAVGYRLYVKIHHPANVDFLVDHIPGFLDVFANGMMAAYFYVRFKDRVGKLAHFSRYCTAFSIVMLLISLEMMKWLYDIRYDPSGFAYWKVDNRFYLAVIFLLLIVSAAFSLRFWVRIVANRFFRFLSVISYNLYIWHQLIARKLVEWRIPDYVGSDPHNDHKWQVRFTILSIATAIAFTSALTYGLEGPLLQKGIKRTWMDIVKALGYLRKNNMSAQTAGRTLRSSNQPVSRR